ITPSGQITCQNQADISLVANMPLRIGRTLRPSAFFTIPDGACARAGQPVADYDDVVNRVTSTASAAETHLFCTLEPHWVPDLGHPIGRRPAHRGPGVRPHRPRGPPAAWTFPQDGRRARRPVFSGSARKPSFGLGCVRAPARRFTLLGGRPSCGVLVPG